MSEGPYLVARPQEPFRSIYSQGRATNPGRFEGNHNDLGKMSDAVLGLGMGAFLLGKAGCADHANQVLSVWFIDPKTRMNPNLQHGQMVRGISTGRGTGIIDTVSLIHAVQGVALLETAGGLDASVARGAALVCRLLEMAQYQ